MFDTLSKRYGWTFDYIWDLSLSEINFAMFEIRREKINNTINEFLKYGKDGIKQIYALPSESPIKIEFLRREKEKEKQDFTRDAKILLLTRAVLDRERKKAHKWQTQI